MRVKVFEKPLLDSELIGKVSVLKLSATLHQEQTLPITWLSQRQVASAGLIQSLFYFLVSEADRPWLSDSATGKLRPAD